MRCLVLAGGTPRPGEPLFAEAGGRPKALLEFGGRPMVQWVLDALADSGAVDHVVLVGLPTASGIEFAGELDLIPNAGTLADNLYSGVERLLELEPNGGRAAFCWSDIPLATGATFARFLVAAETLAPEADVVAGLVRRRDLEQRWPEIREKWLRVREGSFVAADFGVFDPRKAAAVREPMEVLTDQRKSAWRQAGTVGFELMMRYLLGRLTLPALEHELERRYGIRPRVLVAADPELGLDVDGPGNLALCRRRLEAD